MTAAPARRADPRGTLVAAALFLLSGVLQLAASLQRWVVARAALPASDVTYEDHLYDYFWPADPWVPIGGAAELLGAGLLVLAAGIACLAWAATRSGTLWVKIAVIAVVVPTAVMGLHALSSGVAGAPSPLQNGVILAFCALLPFVGLIALGIRWLRDDAPFAALSCIALLAPTGVGYLFATFTLAPVIAGYQSYDTTPWTETIVAVCTVLAAVPLIAHVLAERLFLRSRGGASAAGVG